ncbi:protein NIM1-INTERACTING 1 [Brassica rapa]|uniref:Protein NIM1-INTERACTING 1 n=1 Tax=Brassica campestris TaxID=3711 RepID=M4C9N1_BRACM|nr:protein NIM1-INTERACTING 1 [Brassica rapa]
MLLLGTPNHTILFPFRMAIRSKDTEEENKRINEIDEPEEDEDKKMEMFFNLIRNYQEARKRRRQELIEDSGETAPNPTKRSDNGEKSGIAPPVFRAEDFSHCIDLNLEPIVSTEEEKQEEETEEETREENVLDLNLAL